MRLLVVLLVVLGCKGREAAPSKVTEADAKAFAETLAASVIPCSPEKLAPLAPVETVARGLCDWMNGIASYRLVRVAVTDGQPRPIMRRLLATPAGGMLVNYDELQLARTNGTVTLADAYSYRQAKWLARPTPTPPELEAARDLLRAGKADEALALVDELPATTRRDRAAQMLRIHAAAAISPDRYKQALGELAEMFPADPSIALTEIDGALAVKDYTGALRWLDVLGKAIGDDAFLDTLRAIAHLEQGALDDARTRIDAAIRREPTLAHAHEVKLDIAIAQKRWTDALAVMTELEQHHGTAFDEARLRGEPKLAELVATPEFQQWLAARSSR